MGVEISSSFFRLGALRLALEAGMERVLAGVGILAMAALACWGLYEGYRAIERSGYNAHALETRGQAGELGRTKSQLAKLKADAGKTANTIVKMEGDLKVAKKQLESAATVMNALMKAVTTLEGLQRCKGADISQTFMFAGKSVSIRLGGGGWTKFTYVYDPKGEVTGYSLDDQSGP